MEVKEEQDNDREIDVSETICNLSNLVVFSTTITNFILNQYNNPLCSACNMVPIVINHRLLKESAEEDKEDHRLSFFNKKMRPIRKVLTPLLLTFNITSLVVGSWNVAKKEYLNYTVKKENPFTNEKMIELADEDYSTFVELIFSGADTNSLLTEEEREQLKRLKPYLEQNPYLNYEKVYQRFATIDVIYTEDKNKQEERIAASYNPILNISHVFNGNSIALNLPHEFIHATGSLDTRFLEEGMTSILVAEYCNDGVIEDGYGMEIYWTEIFIAFTGEDIMLQSFSEEKEKILLRELAKGSKEETVKDLFRSIERTISMYRSFLEGKISFPEYFESYAATGEKFLQYWESQTMDYEKEIYIGNCFINTLGGNFSALPKYNFNQNKNLEYGELGYDIESVKEYLNGLRIAISEIGTTSVKETEQDSKDKQRK